MQDYSDGPDPGADRRGRGKDESGINKVIEFFFCPLYSLKVVTFLQPVCLAGSRSPADSRKMKPDRTGGSYMLQKVVLLLFIVALTAGCGGKSKEDLYKEGLKQAREGNQNGAIVLFRNALEKDPNYLDARCQLGRAYLASGKFEQAEKEIQKVLHANPGRNDLKLDLAKAYNGQKKTDLSLNTLKEYLKTNPESADTFETMAIAEALAGRPAVAEQQLLKALSLDPNHVTAKLELAGIYAAQEKQDQARNLLTAFIKEKPSESRAYLLLAQIELSQGRKEQAIKVYEEWAAVDPKSPVPLFKIGGIFYEMGKTDKAFAISEDLVKRYPKRSEGYRLKGMLYYVKKNYAEAITTLQNSIKLQPSLDAYYYLGMSMFARKEYESALSQFRIILDRVPDMNQVRTVVGMIYLGQQRIDEAIAEFQKVVKENDRNALAHNMLGNSYMSKGMFAEGMRELNRATELDPKLVDAYLKRGIYHLSSGNMKETENDLKAAVQVAPAVLSNRLILSAYYLRQNNFDKAVAVLKEGLNNTKADAPLYSNIATVLFMQKKNAEGLGYLQKAKQSDPSFLLTYFTAADFYFKSGEQDKAVPELQAVLQRDPKNLKALLALASFYESKGNTTEALVYYGKAVDTKSPAAYVALAQFYVKKKQGDKALSMIDSALKSLPKNPDLLELKGRILLADQQTKEAVSVFEQLEAVAPERGIMLKIQTFVANKDYVRAADEARRLVEIRPKSAQGYLALAQIYDVQGDRNRAIDELKKGVNADSGSIAALTQLGYAYARKKDFGQAAASFNEAVRKDPRHSAPALFGLGALYDEQGKRQDALKKYREALHQSPVYVPALNNVATLYADNVGGTPKEGLVLAERAVREEPGNPNILDTYGYLLLKNGRAAEARKILERVSSMLPNNQTVSYHLALAYQGTGDRAQALTLVNKALEGGRFPEEARARQLLAELKGEKVKKEKAGKGR